MDGFRWLSDRFNKTDETFYSKLSFKKKFLAKLCMKQPGKFILDFKFMNLLRVPRRRSPNNQKNVSPKFPEKWSFVL